MPKDKSQRKISVCLDDSLSRLEHGWGNSDAPLEDLWSKKGCNVSLYFRPYVKGENSWGLRTSNVGTGEVEFFAPHEGFDSIQDAENFANCLERAGEKTGFKVDVGTISLKGSATVDLSNLDGTTFSREEFLRRVAKLMPETFPCCKIEAESAQKKFKRSNTVVNFHQLETDDELTV